MRRTHGMRRSAIECIICYPRASRGLYAVGRVRSSRLGWMPAGRWCVYTELEEAVFQLLNRNGLLASSVRLPVLLHNLAHLTHACLCGHCETNLDEERRVERLVHRLDQGHTLERVALVRIESARPLAQLRDDACMISNHAASVEHIVSVQVGVVDSRLLLRRLGRAAKGRSVGGLLEREEGGQWKGRPIACLYPLGGADGESHLLDARSRAAWARLASPSPCLSQSRGVGDGFFQKMIGSVFDVTAEGGWRATCNLAAI